MDPPDRRRHTWPGRGKWATSNGPCVGHPTRRSDRPADVTPSPIPCRSHVAGHYFHTDRCNYLPPIGKAGQRSAVIDYNCPYQGFVYVSVPNLCWRVRSIGDDSDGATPPLPNPRFICVNWNGQPGRRTDAVGSGSDRFGTTISFGPFERSTNRPYRRFRAICHGVAPRTDRGA